MDKIKEIFIAFERFDFKVTNYIYIKNGYNFFIEKDFSKKFNIDFDGLVKLLVKVFFNYDHLNENTFPVFIEQNNVIPKMRHYHIDENGIMCFAPPQRPKIEKWKFYDFVNAVNSMINNYFNKEYVGSKTILELEHGKLGLEQYNNLL